METPIWIRPTKIEISPMKTYEIPKANSQG